jgi:hypothetical protein
MAAFWVPPAEGISGGMPAHCVRYVVLASVMCAVSGFVSRFAHIPVVVQGLYRAYSPRISQEIIEETGDKNTVEQRYQGYHRDNPKNADDHLVRCMS